MCEIVYETFLQIDKCESLCKEFYSGPSRSMLACISLSIIEGRYSDIWKDWCFCGVWNWDILRKLCITWSNIILSKRVRKYNVMVVKGDNTKLKNITNFSIFFVLDYSTGYYLSTSQIEGEMKWREREREMKIIV